MTFLKLPPELLLDILSYLGTEFFIQDIQRLAISKQWYDTAMRVFLRDLHFTTRSLERFTKDETVLMGSQPYVATVKLYLAAFNDVLPCPQTDDHPEHELIYKWTDQLNSSLEKLAAALQRCPHMWSLSVVAREPLHSMGNAMVALLSVNLTSLDFDTASSDHSSYGPREDDVDLCRCINALLPTLRRLRCRMDCICESLLETPPQDTPLKLEEVIVNLSISGLSDITTGCRFSKRCPSPSSARHDSWKRAIESRATELALRSNNARMFRVISHVLPSLGVVAFDAMTGRRYHLETGAEWDADGERVDDALKDTEADLFDSDSPVTPRIVL
jgi:hypothetical protein